MRHSSEKVRHIRYEALRKRLKDERGWPLKYLHKIIGKNGEAFKESIGELRREFPEMTIAFRKPSKNGSYVSYTFEITAKDADEIIDLWIASEKIKELVTIL